MRAFSILFVTLLLSPGCSKQQYAQCDAPNEDLKVMFKPKITGHPFSHSFCIVCNTEIEPEEYYDWAVSMGGNVNNPVNPEAPCLYVYSSSEEDTDTLAACKSLVCDGTASYSDMVSPNNGNIDLGPMLDDSALIEEEWMILDEGQVMIAKPDCLKNASQTF